MPLTYNYPSGLNHLVCFLAGFIVPAKQKRGSLSPSPTPAVSHSALLRSIPLAKIREVLGRAGIQTRARLPYELLVLLLIAVTLQHTACDPARSCAGCWTTPA